MSKQQAHSNNSRGGNQQPYAALRPLTFVSAVVSAVVGAVTAAVIVAAAVIAITIALPSGARGAGVDAVVLAAVPARLGRTDFARANAAIPTIVACGSKNKEEHWGDDGEKRDELRVGFSGAKSRKVLDE